MSFLQRSFTLKDGSILTIREAQIEDASAILDYVKVVGSETNFLSFGSEGIDVSVEEEESIIAKHKKSNNELFLVAFQGLKLASVINMESHSKIKLQHNGEMGISVAQEFWGLGIGNLMLSALVDWAKNNGITRKINLLVSIDNERAIALYKKHGFYIQGTLSRDFLMDGEFKDAYSMGLEID